MTEVLDCLRYKKPYKPCQENVLKVYQKNIIVEIQHWNYFVVAIRILILRESLKTNKCETYGTCKTHCNEKYLQMHNNYIHLILLLPPHSNADFNLLPVRNYFFVPLNWNISTKIRGWNTNCAIYIPWITSSILSPRS